MAVQLLGTPKIVENKIHGTIQVSSKTECVPHMKFGDDEVAWGCFVITEDGEVGCYGHDDTWHWWH